MADFRKFTDFTDTIPDWLTTSVSGSGAVSIISNQLVIDTGGTDVTDAAIAVINTAFDFDKYYHCFMEVERAGDNIGANPPFMMTLLDSASEPTIGARATLVTNKRCWFEDQHNATLANSRVVYKLKNSSATEYHWRSNTNVWQLAFFQTHKHWANADTYVFGFVIDGPNSKIRWLGFHQQDTGEDGFQLWADSDWVPFGTDLVNIDPIDNSLWLVIGNPENDAANYDVTYKLNWLMVSDDSLGDETYFYTNAAVSPDSFPTDYDIYLYFGLMAIDGNPFLISIEPANTDGDSIVVPKSDFAGALWVKDPHVVGPISSNYYMFVNVRGADGLSDIWVGTSTDLLVWSDWTEIITASGDVDKWEFPFVWYEVDAARFHMFLSQEDTTPNWSDFYTFTDAATPASGWQTPTLKLEKPDEVQWDDDGRGQPFIQNYDSTWILWYSGITISPLSIWNIHYSENADADVNSTYTIPSVGPTIERTQIATTIDGDQTGLQITVADTTGFAAGNLIFTATDKPNYIVSVDSGTLMTLKHWVDVDDSDPVRQIDYNSVAIRWLKAKTGGGWIGNITPFKFPLGGRDEKTVFIKTDDADPRTATWVICSEPISDIPYSSYIVYVSNENTGTVWLDITPAPVVVDSTDKHLWWPPRYYPPDQILDHRS